VQTALHETTSRRDPMQRFSDAFCEYSLVMTVTVVSALSCRLYLLVVYCTVDNEVRDE